MLPLVLSIHLVFCLPKPLRLERTSKYEPARNLSSDSYSMPQKLRPPMKTTGSSWPCPAHPLHWHALPRTGPCVPP